MPRVLHEIATRYPRHLVCRSQGTPDNVQTGSKRRLVNESQQIDACTCEEDLAESASHILKTLRRGPHRDNSPLWHIIGLLIELMWFGTSGQTAVNDGLARAWLLYLSLRILWLLANVGLYARTYQRLHGVDGVQLCVLADSGTD